MRARGLRGYRGPVDRRRLSLASLLRPENQVVIDHAVTTLILIVYLASRMLVIPDGVPHWITGMAIAVAVLPAALRHRWPRAALAAVTAGSAVAIAISSAPVPALAPAFVIYLIPLRFPVRDALWLLAGTLAVTTAGMAGFATIRHGAYGRGGVDQAGLYLLESGLLILAAWLAGYAVRQQRAAAASRREQAERGAREQRAEALRANTEERLRIARELHDVVAHSLTLITVQAGVANYVTAQDPGQAAQALSSIEQLSRGALTEMRALLGVLRAGDPEPDKPREPHTLPAPGLADLTSLAERTTAAGVRVDLDITGPLPPLPAGLDLAVYRVIQEAITNVVKHAAATRCQVTVACHHDALTIEVTDDGTGQPAPAQPALAQPAPGTGTGHGITGMRERVGMYGGELRAAPLPDHGFQVTARFPLPAAAAA
jgi:signal transduction histidine kinase